MEGDDFNEPICDAVRAILDGHIILSRRLAAAGHYPAIDVLHSVSRLSFPARRPRKELSAVRKVREALAVYEESRDLIELGAYVAGTNPELDASMRIRPEITDFLRQDVSTNSSRAESLASLDKIAQRL